MSLTLPGTPNPETQQDLASDVQGFKPSLGEYLGAQIAQGFYGSPTGGALRQATLPGNTPDALTREQWKESPYYREGLPFEDYMGADRAKARAELYDDNSYRQWLISQRKAGLFGSVAGFGAQILGGAADPLNYVPFGAAERIALAARAIGLGEKAVPSIIGHAAEVGLQSAAVEPLVAAEQHQMGDDLTWGQAVTDIAAGATFGGVLGGAGEGLRAVRGAPSFVDEVAAEQAFSQSQARLREQLYAGVDDLNVGVSNLAGHREAGIAPSRVESALPASDLRGATPEQARAEQIALLEAKAPEPIDLTPAHTPDSEALVAKLREEGWSNAARDSYGDMPAAQRAAIKQSLEAPPAPARAAPTTQAVAAEGAGVALPATSVAEPTRIPGRVRPSTGQVLEAATDVNAFRASGEAAPKGPKLLTEIRRLGGIKTKVGADLTSEGGDVLESLGRGRKLQPGLVNNKSGLEPDKIREALQQQGWFGERGDQGTSLNDLYDLLRQEQAGGAVHPRSAITINETRARLEPEFARAGIAETDTPAVAALKLAEHRATTHTVGEKRTADWQERARAAGIEGGENWTRDDYMAAVIEHEAQTADGEALDRLEAEMMDTLRRDHPDVAQALEDARNPDVPFGPVSRDPFDEMRALTETTLTEDDGQVITFPDANHREMYRYGGELAAGARPDPGLRQELFDRFKGYVVEDPAMGETFRSPDDVDALARDYYETERTQGDGAGASLIDPDALDAYHRAAMERLSQRIKQEASRAQKQALDEIERKMDQWLHEQGVELETESRRGTSEPDRGDGRERGPAGKPQEEGPGQEPKPGNAGEPKQAGRGASGDRGAAAAARGELAVDPDLADITRDYEALDRAGAIPEEARTEYETAAAEADRYEQGIDPGYESAMVCWRRGELE